MPDIITQVDRISELSSLLLEMTNVRDMKKFWELDRKFNELMALNKLEDDPNAN